MYTKAIILDWAGTTVDFGCMAPLNAFKQSFLEKGIELTNDMIRKPMGQAKRDHIYSLLEIPEVHRQWIEKFHRIPNEKDINDLYERFKHYVFADLSEYAHVKSGTVQAVELFRQMDYKIGSTTGYTREMMQIVAEVAKAEGYSPDLIVTPEDASNYGRPYPYMIYQNMCQLGIKNIRDIIKVGDTISDIEEGKNAGCFTVGVLQGSSLVGLSEEEYQSLAPLEKQSVLEKAETAFRAAGADICVLNLFELADILSQKKVMQIS